VIHERHFTVAEANEELARVEPLLRSLATARDRLTDAEAHEVLAEKAPTNGGGAPGRAIGGAFLEVRSLLAELAGLGIVVRDIDRGLVDFPAVLDGREVYLCWDFDDDEVGHWHELDSGYASRRPLP
jgi:hypothetical protein